MKEERLLTIKEAAQRLTVKESTLRKWRFTGDISVVRIGSRLIRFPESEIDRIIREGTEPE